MAFAASHGNSRKACVSTIQEQHGTFDFEDANDAEPLAALMTRIMPALKKRLVSYYQEYFSFLHPLAT